MLRTEMPWYAKLGTAILATAIGGGCIIAILLTLPTGLAWDLGNWRRQLMLEEQRIKTLAGGHRGSVSQALGLALLHYLILVVVLFPVLLH